MPFYREPCILRKDRKIFNSALVPCGQRRVFYSCAGPPGRPAFTPVIVALSEVMFMQTIGTIRARIEAASGLTEVLAASWDAFEFTRAATSAYAERAPAELAMFLYAGSAACGGRDAIYTAPSAPAELADLAGVDAGGPGGNEAAGLLAGLALAVSRRLRAVAGQAADPRDRDACAEAAGAADELHRILTGTG
jgi:hypothetical protein